MQAIAHRGASGYAPENTRMAFDKAIALESDSIETDVQLTADGRMVLFHDGTVDRTSDGQGPVADYTLEELRRLDIGGWFAPEFAGERVLTPAEMLDDYVNRIPIVFEIKDLRATAPLVALLTERGVLDRVQVTSFAWPALLDAQALNPDLALGFLTPSFDLDTIERIARRGFAQICPPADRLTARRVGLAHARGLSVRAWRVERRDQVERLTETGVDGATCNWPDWLVTP